MFELQLKNIPKLEELRNGAPSETKICTQCNHPKDIEAFGWRYCYEERLEICKYCRNANAKAARQLKQFVKFNAMTVMSWKPKNV